MKVYDLQWFTTFDMSCDEAAEALAEDGIDTILTQNRIDPLPDSGVDQRDYLARFGDKLATYSDTAWMDALKRHGLRVLQTTAALFDPPALARYPDARPFNANGVPEERIDWYIGVCPTHETYLAEKITKLNRVVDELQPDGLFLQFIRYPGFWENWTWSPDYIFSDADRFCFCDRCRSRFSDYLGRTLPPGDAASQARFILTQHAIEWTDWRCQLIAEIVGRVRNEVLADHDEPRLMINTLPFPSSDFDGQDVRRTIAAQDLRQLARHAERFELMTYLQILNRPTTWARTAIEDARADLDGLNREVVCTLQVDALYTEGIHGPRMRKAAVTADDLLLSANAALDAGADGLVFYHWTDFLTDEAAGGRKREALRAITRA
jgi:hypothetical protein